MMCSGALPVSRANANANAVRACTHASTCACTQKAHACGDLGAFHLPAWWHAALPHGVQVLTARMLAVTMVRIKPDMVFSDVLEALEMAYGQKTLFEVRVCIMHTYAYTCTYACTYTCKYTYTYTYTCAYTCTYSTRTKAAGW